MEQDNSFDRSARRHGAPRRPGPLRLAALLAGVVLVLGACSGGSSTTDAGDDAGGYPDQAITIVVPFAAGGPTDTGPG